MKKQNVKPVFVYGTLKSNIPVNYTMLDTFGWELLEKKEATINGNLYIVPRSSFPAIGELNTQNLIHGELVYINDRFILKILDQIEGEGYMYKRISTVTTDGEECWIYQWNNIIELEHRIEHGNFQHMKAESILFIPMRYENEKITRVYIPSLNRVIDI